MTEGRAADAVKERFYREVGSFPVSSDQNTDCCADQPDTEISTL